MRVSTEVTNYKRFLRALGRSVQVAGTSSPLLNTGSRSQAHHTLLEGSWVHSSKATFGFSGSGFRVFGGRFEVSEFLLFLCPLWHIAKLKKLNAWT